MHVLNRAAYGPTPTLLAQLSGGPANVTAWITQQLAPNLAVDNADTTTLLAQVPTIPQGAPYAIEWMILEAETRAAYSDWQLNEVLTRFWSEHFNRSFDVNRFKFQQLGPGIGFDHAAFFCHEDDRFYRANALGYFDDLLRYTAGSPSMLIYLDNHQNTASNGNENWGRELLELYSMGEKDRSTGVANYSQNDVIGVARCFTAWKVVPIPGTTPQQFQGGFGPRIDHDMTLKNLFAGTPHRLTVPANQSAFADGNLVISHLAGTSATADFMVRKLMVLFLGDDAPTRFPATLANAKAAWGTRGDIRRVVGTILGAAEFLGARTQWEKIKSPLRHSVSMLRALGTRARIPPGPLLMQHMLGTGFVVEVALGQPLTGTPAPDGWPQQNARQISVSGFGDRADFASRIVPQPGEPFYPLWLAVWEPLFDVYSLVPLGLSPSQEADFLLQLHFADKVLNLGEHALVVAELSTGLPLRHGFACELIQSFTHFCLH